MEQQDFIDRRPIDSFIFDRLVEYGYTPSAEEAQVITDIFFELLMSMGIDVVEIDEDDMDEPEFRRF
jgi:hypothetical protein